MAGVPNPCVISEKLVKFLWIEVSSGWSCCCCCCLAFPVCELVVWVLFELLLLLLPVMPSRLAGVQFRPQTGDLSRFKTSMNSSRIWLRIFSFCEQRAKVFRLVSFRSFRGANDD